MLLLAHQSRQQGRDLVLRREGRPRGRLLRLPWLRLSRLQGAAVAVLLLLVVVPLLRENVQRSLL